MTKSCDGCKWWSDQLARSIGLATVEAYCLNGDSRRWRQYAHLGCDKYEAGEPVDATNAPPLPQ